jgi:hypothetical protein
MKKSAALIVVALASQAIVSFAGPPPPKEVVPAPPPPPVSYFRPNEFDIGAFATYATWTGNNPTGTSTRFISVPPFPTQTITTTLSGDVTPSGWGGGMDFTYWFPWKYLGVRFQGAGLSLSTGTFTVTENLNGIRQASRTGSVSTSAGVITSDLMLRLPLDDFWPGVHLAPYIMGGLGAIFGGNSATINTRFPDLNARFNNATRLRSSPLGNIGGGLEYRFTPNIGLFGEAGYNFVSHGGNRGANTNFVQTNFGLRYAF